MEKTEIALIFLLFFIFIIIVVRMYVSYKDKAKWKAINKKNREELVEYKLQIESYTGEDNAEYRRLCYNAKDHLYSITLGFGLKSNDDPKEILEDINHYLSGNWNKDKNIWIEMNNE